VGSIFRTADGAGVTNIYISGHTPQPIDRFGRKRKDIAKVALGAENSVEWQAIKDPLEFVKKMKSEGVVIVVLEQDKKSVSLDDSKMLAEISEQPTLLVLGSEVNGVQKAILNVADYIVEIPMKGKKESLNVSVASGVAMFSLF
jgi:tRNA G18 (ribose-2'-O)-methylase SpoU